MCVYIFSEKQYKLVKHTDEIKGPFHEKGDMCHEISNSTNCFVLYVILIRKHSAIQLQTVLSDIISKIENMRTNKV